MSKQNYNDYDPTYIKVQDVKKIIKTLKIPKQYWKMDLDSVFSHDYTMLFSIRENAGKTTQTLLLGLVLRKLYGTRTEYMRCDESQISRSSVETLYDTVTTFGYIEKIFGNGSWNNIEYSTQKKAFTLVRVEDDRVVKRDTDPVCVLHSLENYRKYKSSYNSPKGDYLVLDEMFDSSRPTFRQMTELSNNISTIGRVGSKHRRNNVHVICLGNNTDQYSHWFDDFCIADKIKDLQQYGAFFDYNTELGTSIYCKLLEVDEKKKAEVQTKNIKFFGFPTEQMAQFNGTRAWLLEEFAHIPEIDMLENGRKIFNRLYINHRNRYVQLDLYSHPDYGYYVFLHWSNKPKLADNIILTLTPVGRNEVYGVGRYNVSDTMFKTIQKYTRLKEDHRWYFENNQIGSLVEDYFRNI